MQNCDPLQHVGLWSGRLEQDGLQREARRIAEFASERLTQSVDNLIRMDPSAGADHVDQRVTVDQRIAKAPMSSTCFSLVSTAIRRSMKPAALSESLIGSILL